VKQKSLNFFLAWLENCSFTHLIVVGFVTFISRQDDMIHTTKFNGDKRLTVNVNVFVKAMFLMIDSIHVTLNCNACQFACIPIIIIS